MATAVNASAAKTWLRLGHSVKHCHPSPEQYCRTAGAGSLGKGRDPVPAECKAVMVIYTLELAMLGSANLQAACEFNPSAWPCLLDWLLLLRNQPIARSSVLCCNYIFATFVIQVQQCQNMQLGLRASLEKDAGALWRQPCRMLRWPLEEMQSGLLHLRWCVCKGKGLLYRHQMPLPASAPSYGRKCLAFQLGQK